jgi:hypothetical protein
MVYPHPVQYRPMNFWLSSADPRIRDCSSALSTPRVMPFERSALPAPGWTFR